jgi:glyoxylase-like metal-dependent hydrolase (beta-lactamase superfamily II)
MYLSVRAALYSLIILHLISCSNTRNLSTDLNKTTWIHGTKDCKDNNDPAIQVVRFTDNTWILRQNKCVNYEAAFLFLFTGNKKALLMDTGATEDDAQFPLYKTIRNLLDTWERKNNRELELIVAHTHAHSDHTAGDIQFKGKPNTTVVGLSAEDVQSFFKINQWPTDNVTIDLGDRVITIIPIPGHEKSSIAVYDQQSQILLSGDSFYPGRLYIRDWVNYKASIQRLTNFTQTHKISYILGNHIEMTNEPGKDYPTGTTFQPDEHALPLTVNDLLLLNQSLKTIGDNPVYKIYDSFIIVPKN